MREFHIWIQVQSFSLDNLSLFCSVYECERCPHIQIWRKIAPSFKTTGSHKSDVTTTSDPSRHYLEKCLSIRENINILFFWLDIGNKGLLSCAKSACAPLLFTCFCSALSSACLQSVGHPADTILAPFTRVCWPQPAFVVCILNAQQRGIPFGPVVSWKKPSATALFFTWPEERLQAQIKRRHTLYGPQQRMHSFRCSAAGRITLTHKCFYGFHS